MHRKSKLQNKQKNYVPGAFLAAAVWGGQRDGQICIGGRGGARISDDIMHDWVNGVIRHQLCDATL